MAWQTYKLPGWLLLKGTIVKRIILSIAACLLTYTGALALMRPADPTYAQLAEQVCPAEWATLNAFDPPLYLDHYKKEALREPGTNMAENAVMHRPFIGALATADFVNHLFVFDRAENHTPYNLAHTQARLDFMKCLNPSEAERRQILKIYSDVYPEASKQQSEVLTYLFAMTDNLFCMGFDRFFEGIKKLDPTNPYYHHSHFHLNKTTMTVCPKPTPPTQSPD
jgi:hypothetical protein